jgi:hypothetical protein
MIFVQKANLFDIFYRNFSSWMIEFSIIFYAACYCSTFYIVFTAFFKTKRCFVRQIIVYRKGLKQLLNPVISRIIKISVDNTWLGWISDGHSLRCPNSGRLKFRLTLTSTLIILDITKNSSNNCLSCEMWYSDIVLGTPLSSRHIWGSKLNIEYLCCLFLGGVDYTFCDFPPSWQPCNWFQGTPIFWLPVSWNYKKDNAMEFLATGGFFRT